MASDDSLVIKNPKHLVENPEIDTNLMYIKSNFRFLITVIIRLKTSKMLLIKSVSCIQQVKH